MTTPYPDSGTRRIITASAMVATLMVTLDGTIAAVALPHIQASVSASPEQVVWILTSYLIAEAIATPLSAWTATRFGRKTVMVISVVGFTLASAACGAATSLIGLVLFRALQGAFGAALVPLCQAVLLDINPPDKQGQAMALYGMGAVAGPVIGPLLGGLLTDAFSWRWVFLVNLPFGVLACAGMILYMPETKKDSSSRIYFVGFSLLSVFLASLQLLLDRGQQLDWFSSWEIRGEGTVALIAAYLTVVNTCTVKGSFINLALFKDRNYLTGSVISTLLGVLIFAMTPLVSSLLQQQMGYPVVIAGIISAPRGLGTMVSMLLVGSIIRYVDQRLLLCIGLVLSAAGMYPLATMSLDASSNSVLASGIIHGFASGFIFVPLSMVVFSTLKPSERNEGSAMFALTRNVGAAVGISFLQSMNLRNTARVQSRLAEVFVPGSPIVAMRAPDFDAGDPVSVAAMSAQIARHASMVAYVDCFWLLLVATLIMIPFVLLIRPPKVPVGH